MRTIRLTTAQALVRAMQAQMIELDATGDDGTAGQVMPFFAGVWAIFGHGNVAGMGEALHGARATLPTYRAHNEQAMVHAAVAYAKANRRQRAMACTTSIGPGALNMVTACALAHVNRLPVLLLPGDVFAGRQPDPVLQQVEDFEDGTVSANDCFRPVSRYFDRLTRPEQLIAAFPRAMAVLTDPAQCGPVTLSLCQDVQAQAHDFPESLFAERIHRPRRPRPDLTELAAAAAALRAARRPFVIAGGGVLYSRAERELADFCARRGIPVGETQAGKSTLPFGHPMAMGSIGVTGSSSANDLAAASDVVLAVGTRLADFTTGSWALFQDAGMRLIGLNAQPFDAGKHAALPLVADARAGLAALDAALGDWSAPSGWSEAAGRAREDWLDRAAAYTDAPSGSTQPSDAPPSDAPPSDAQVIGAVQRASHPTDVVVTAAGGLPGELHSHWRASMPGGYHAEYGFSCMGYEIAGGLGIKMADPSREVIVMVGDGSYLMLNSEIATSVMLGHKLILVLLDNRGYGCIDRLQRSTGGASFNNMLADTLHETLPEIDFAAHARALGAVSERVPSLAALPEAMQRARASDRTYVVVIETEAVTVTDVGGHWWDVAVPEVSVRPSVQSAREEYVARRERQRAG